MTLTASATINDRFAASSGRFPLSGVQALVRLIVDVRRADRAQGLDTAAFVSGYEGSPLAGLDLELQRREQLLAEHDIVFRPAVNEELAATAVQGTQLVAGHEDARVAGITGFWYGKSPGVDRASDALRHANLIGTKPRGVTQLPLVARTPYFCSGCPHNSSTKVPAGSMVGGGIGCHALVLMMEPDAVGEVTGLTQMGDEGAQWIGMEPFLRTRKHLLQNIGDGTFHHSGSLAVRAAIASGADITYKLLYNSAVAMTGGQDAVGAMVEAEFGPGATVSYRLHPPVLRALGPAPQDPPRLLVQAALLAAGGDEGPARHAFRPVRPYSCPPPRARADHRVSRGRGGPARPPDRGHPGRLRPHRGPARPGPRLRADQDRQRRPLPHTAARRPRHAADRGREPGLML